MRHLTIRMAWHDAAWNGPVCSKLSRRASCYPGRYHLGFTYIDAAGDEIVWERLAMLGKQSSGSLGKRKLACNEANGFVLGREPVHGPGPSVRRFEASVDYRGPASDRSGPLGASGRRRAAGCRVVCAAARATGVRERRDRLCIASRDRDRWASTARRDVRTGSRRPTDGHIVPLRAVPMRHPSPETHPTESA